MNYITRFKTLWERDELRGVLMADLSIRSGRTGATQGLPPTGTVTFLFTDIEGSTKLWERYPDAMKAALARHDEILRAAIETHGGYVFKTVGDAFCAAFSTAPDALEATLSAQRALSAEAWGETGPLKVRSALHTGAAEERGGDYFGPPLNRIARLLSAGHGGQILLSLATQELARDHLPEGVGLRDMGEHRLKDLARPEHVFQLVAPDLPADFVPLKTLDTHPNNLPAQLTPLIGREKEVEAGCKLLLRDDIRLVTLTGPGGTGKTRLGLQVAADLIDSFESGVFFVPLAPISDPNLVASTIARTLGLQETGSQPLIENLRNHLRDKEMLLLLDNFEQVVSAAPLVSDLLATCPRLKVLATSREVLHLRGEKEFQVPPLTLPDPKRLPPMGADLVSALSQYEAVRLFIQRALDVKPDFAVTNENAPAVAEICHRLDGLPLAIELAAVRIKLLTPQAMLGRLSSRMKLLTGGARDLPARQQTIRNAIAWSYDLLDEEEKKLFRRLSVFVGGFTFEAAEAVCNAEGDPSTGSGQALGIDVLDGVSSLVDKSLLRQEEVKGESRFMMLETIREYGLERLAESREEEAARRYHLNFFMALAEEAEPKLNGPDQIAWLDRLEVELDNLRAALEWSLACGEVEEGLRLGGALWWFWFLRGYFSEGYKRLERAIAESRGKSESVRAKALYVVGHLAHEIGNFERAAAMCEESLALFKELGDKSGIASSTLILGVVAGSQGNSDRVVTLGEESLRLFRELGDKWGIALALYLLGGIARYRGDYGRATTLFEESLSLLRELENRSGIAYALHNLGAMALIQGDHVRAAALCKEGLTLSREIREKRGMAWSLNVLSLVAVRQGDYRQAETLCEECITLFREVGYKTGIALSLNTLGLIAQHQGDHVRAAALYKEGLSLSQELGIKDIIAQHIEGLAVVAGAQGQPERGAKLFGAAEALREAIGTPLSPSDRAEYDRSVAAVRTQLSEEAFRAAWEEGRKMTIEKAVEYALKSEAT
jgi:predicted ATPase/class 3 adenylate cyclase